jgi:alkanesulfonate monooxygenase SsuD/methylene tetrahydromethanopterin reductase-like flavin-dependent oxidoreductase (luciferase family)
MRFSLFYDFDVLPGKEASELYDEIEEQAIVADQLGFDAIWLARHHGEQKGGKPSPLLSLARISALTRSIELGTTIARASFYHPLRVAEDIALLDVLSGGRARLGLGSGIVNAWSDFVHFDSSLDTKTARMLEMLAVLRQAFDEGGVDFIGNYYRYEGVENLLQPLQPAHNLIWVAGNNATSELAGVAGYNLLLPNRGSPIVLHHLLDRYQAHLDGKPGFVAQPHFIYVADCEQDAQEQMRKMLTRYEKEDHNFTWDGYVDSHTYADLSRRFNVLIGTPEHITEQLLLRKEEYGIDEIICQVYTADMQHRDARRSIIRLGHEVLPRFQTQQLVTVLE